MKASGLMNSLIANHSLSLGCRIALGKKLIQDVVTLLPPDSRDEVIAHVIEALFAMRAPLVSVVDQADPIISLEEAIVVPGIIAGAAMAGARAAAEFVSSAA